jgi:hypothetical protein
MDNTEMNALREGWSVLLQGRIGEHWDGGTGSISSSAEQLSNIQGRFCSKKLVS